MVTVKEFVRTDAPGPAHPCDASGLSAIEFLTAVYNDPTFPMSIRIDAARALLPYTEPRPTNSFHQPILPRCKIIIPYEPSLAPRSPDGSTENHSHFPDRAHKTLSHGAEITDPINTETNSYPLNFPDYSTPPTPDEIRETKAIVQSLLPDTDLSDTPDQLFLCPCGHWVHRSLCMLVCKHIVRH